MVEILERKELKKYRIICRKCGSLLRFSQLDEECRYTPDSYAGETTDWHIICPNCNTRVPTRSITNAWSYDWRELD